MTIFLSTHVVSKLYVRMRQRMRLHVYKIYRKAASCHFLTMKWVIFYAFFILLRLNEFYHAEIASVLWHLYYVSHKHLLAFILNPVFIISSPSKNIKINEN